MRQPTFIFEGEECPVDGIDWNKDGTLSHVTFYDLDGNFHTAFTQMEHHKEGYDEHELLHTDLKKALKYND